MTVAIKRPAMTEVGPNGKARWSRNLSAAPISECFRPSSVYPHGVHDRGLLNAAIKLVPADPALTEVQLWHWKTAATSRIRTWSGCSTGVIARSKDARCLYVVMEYAEETLSQILHSCPRARRVRECWSPARPRSRSCTVRAGCRVS